MNTLEHVFDCVEAIPWVGLEVGDVLRVRPGAVLWSREGQPGGSAPALIFEGAACKVKPDGSLLYEATFLPMLLYVLALEPWAVRARGNSLPPGTLWERRVRTLEPTCVISRMCPSSRRLFEHGRPDKSLPTLATITKSKALTLIRGGADQ
jgi:hypothetical protein